MEGLHKEEDQRLDSDRCVQVHAFMDATVTNVAEAFKTIGPVLRKDMRIP
jgi:hypothetical protein